MRGAIGLALPPKPEFTLYHDAHGPQRTSAVSYDAAMQLRQTGHFCIVLHFEMANDGRLMMPPRGLLRWNPVRATDYTALGFGKRTEPDSEISLQWANGSYHSYVDHMNNAFDPCCRWSTQRNAAAPLPQIGREGLIGQRPLEHHLMNLHQYSQMSLI